MDEHDHGHEHHEHHEPPAPAPEPAKEDEVWFHNGEKYVRALTVHEYGGEGNPRDLFAPNGDNFVVPWYRIPQQPQNDEGGGLTYYLA